jgi:dihydroxyacetone kinase
MKHFINNRSDIVTEAIDAAVMLGEGKLARLDGYPAIKVVVRADWDRSKVAVLSGGGGGHEPTHAGFVGDGMLTAAVCGEIFASPSVNAVLEGILAVTGEAGCLLIVKNYTGDRLNFGFAATKARALGYKVEMVIVSDDIAIAGASQPRGLAGTLFVHKVAGHFARAGAPLHVVKEAAERVASGIRTLGLAVSIGTIPGEPTDNRLGPDEVEIGLGIHGEPGAAKIPYRPIRELAATIVDRLDQALGPTKAPLALLINNLGSVPPLEMAVTTGAILSAFKRDVALVFGGEGMVTSLDMKGFSITALPLDDEIAHALKSGVGPRAWVPGRAVRKVAPLPLSSRLRAPAPVPSANAARRRVVETACHTLLGLESTLNALDEKVGDGDAGTTFATAARTILAELDRLPFAEPSALCAAIADRLSTVMGGSSGILLSIGVAAMGATLADTATPDWPTALLEGVRRIQHYGGAKAGDRTMIDALLPAATALKSGETFAAATAAARLGADSTATMKSARAGRSSYVPEAALRGVPDPGAIAIASVFEALAAIK